MSAATVPGTPLRTDTGSMTPVRTPGIHSDMSTPDLHQLTAGSTAIQQPLSSGPSSLHAAFGGSHANTLFSGTLPPESGQSAPRASTASADAVEALQAELAVCNAAAEGLWKALESSQMETGKLQAALVAAEGVGADALKQATAAAEAREHAEVELAALQDVRKRMLDQLQETEAANASLKEQVETAEGAKATAHTYAQGQIAAAVAARTSAESLRQEASAARAELEAARAENKSLQVRYHVYCSSVQLIPMLWRTCWGCSSCSSRGDFNPWVVWRGSSYTCGLYLAIRESDTRVVLWCHWLGYMSL